MTGTCCTSGRGPHPLARRLSEVIASILPAGLLVLLPKCPLCLTMWLALATGLSVPVAGIAWLRGGIVLLWAGAIGGVVWRRRNQRRLTPIDKMPTKSYTIRIGGINA